MACDTIGPPAMESSPKWKDARECFKTSCDRSRSVFYVLVLTSMILFAIVPNARINWPEAKYGNLRATMLYMSDRHGDNWGLPNEPRVKEQMVTALTEGQAKGNKFVGQFYWFLNINKKSDRAVLRTLVMSQFAEAEKRRMDAQSFALPLLPTQFDLNDYGRIFGVMVCSMTILLGLALKREHSCLQYALTSFEEGDDKAHGRKLLSLDPVLYEPGERFKVRILDIFMVAPLGLLFWIWLNELNDMKDQLVMHADLTKREFVFTTVCVVIELMAVAFVLYWSYRIADCWKKCGTEAELSATQSR